MEESREVTLSDLASAMEALRHQPPLVDVGVGQDTGVSAWSEADGTIVISRTPALQVEIQEGSPLWILKRVLKQLRNFNFIMRRPV